MARVHEIGVGADTKPFEDGIRRGVIKPAEDAEKALERLEDSAGTAGRDGSKDLDRLEDTLRDVARQSKRTEDAVDDIGDTGGRGFGKVREGAQEVTQEIGSNLGEAVSSIRDDFGDLAQVGQDTLGGLAATLASTGPAGIAGAVGLAAAAVGWGLISSNLQQQTEQAEALRDRLSSAYLEANSAGQEYLTTAYLVKDANDVMYNPERAGEWQKLQDTQKETGLAMSTILKANSGDLASIEIVQGRINGLIQEQIDANFEANGVAFQYSRELQRVEDWWRVVGETAEDSSRKSQDATKTTNDLLLEQIANSKTVGQEYDELGNKLLTLEDGTQIFIDVNTGQAYLETDRFKGDVDGVIRELNGKKVVIDLEGTTVAAQRAFDEFMRRNENKVLPVRIAAQLNQRGKFLE